MRLPKALFVSLLFLGLLLTIPQDASADLLIPGQRGVGYCFEISNLDDFADYVIIAKFMMPGPPENEWKYDTGEYKVIERGDCLSFYKFAKPSIHAIRKVDFSEGEDKIYHNDTRLISSGIEITSVNTVMDTDPTKSIRDVLEIVSLSDDSFELEMSKVVYTYVDGTTEEIEYTTQDQMPVPSKKPLIPVSPYILTLILLYIFVPIAAIIIIAAILVRRK